MRVIRWKPFLAIGEADSYFPRRIVHFRCPICGSSDCERPAGERSGDCFLAGRFMCSRCGATEHQGEEFNYYGPCWEKVEEIAAEEPSLFGDPEEDVEAEGDIWDSYEDED